MTARIQTLWTAFALLALAQGGCVSMLGGMIATAPNHANDRLVHSPPRLPSVESMMGFDETFRVKVGPPEAMLNVCVQHPVSKKPPEPAIPRGTIIVLHGMGARSAWMHGTGQMLARHGYRAVLIDLRGHGTSSGQRLTYGLGESCDVSQVITELDARGLIAGKLGVYGISYGAATAIHLAAIDRRVSAIVAVAPFSDMRSEVSHYIRNIGIPGVGPFLEEDHIQNSIDEAGLIGGFDPDLADAALAIERTRTPVLLVHGTNDRIIPSEHSKRLHEHAPQHSELLLLDGDGHFSVWMDMHGKVAKAACAWFDKHIATDQEEQKKKKKK